MDHSALITELDREIERLQRVRALLESEPAKRGPGRPKKVASTSTGAASQVKRGPKRPRSAEKARAPGTRKKRVMSAEGRARIAAAQKTRWAKQKS